MSSAQPSNKANREVIPHDNDSMAKKVLSDIAFLEDRLIQLEKQRTPNTVVIKTYKDMLQSRQSVLNWLKEHRASSLKNIQ
ncbi:hypothetical protein NBRC116493_04860 [Aurantivibrio infirmus]